ncbi:MAG TPA: GRP family sugar transporter [Terracidiphilus sp.]|jgi:glucose uptake protein|nr:GRP family sugar transporter [Terracidiphilus sp.]
MLVPETYQAALLLMLLSMLCWGSWANTLKLCPGYRFQLFYWDYAIGVLLAAVLLGLTAGSSGSQGNPFLSDVIETPLLSIKLAVLGGVVFNIANLLLVAAIDVAGLAVAFPVGIGLALIVGSVWSYLVNPKGNLILLFGGVALVTVAIVLDAAAYRKRETATKATTTRGIVLSLIAGLLMGSFYPLVARAMQGDGVVTGPGPYAIALFFAVGVLLSTLPANWILMIKPLDGKPRVRGSEYWGALWRWHFAGILGGMIWCVGAVTNFLGSGAHKIGPAVSYSIGQGATMVSACWGVFVWHEFAGAPPAAKRLLALMFAFFLLGLVSIALAPLY